MDNNLNPHQMDFENLLKESDAVKMEDVTPNVESIPTPDEQVKQTSGFRFDEMTGGSPEPQPNGGAVPPPPTPKSASKPVSIAGIKATGRLFEKVLDELCRYKHGVSLDDIGATINEKDLNLASELTAEAMEQGELPKIPSWLTLVILVSLIFAYPTYKVFTFKPYKPTTPTPPMTGGIDFSQPDQEINPRTKKPYVRGKYNRKKK